MQEFTPDTRSVKHVRPSPNHDARTPETIDLLLLHYTGMASTDAAITRLCDPEAKVSAHYLVDETGAVLQMVPEARRAWHAGLSSWDGATDINSRAIGIEIANSGHGDGYPDFPDIQIEAVIALCRDIVARRRIGASRVLAHSDVAPLRKRDPGEKFPWKRLHHAGIGAWVEPAAMTNDAGCGPGMRGTEITDLQNALRRYGYGLEPTGVYDEPTTAVVTAFQRHFRPKRVDGIADISTRATLDALLAARGR